MKIVIEFEAEKKEYELGKLIRAKDRIYTEASNKLTENAKKEEDTDDEDYDLMVSTLVKLYDNQFTEEEINENMETADITTAFMDILIYKQTKLNKNMEQRRKDFTKGK